MASTSATIFTTYRIISKFSLGRAFQITEQEKPMVEVKVAVPEAIVEDRNVPVIWI
jgi:hypothetical protein